MFVFAGRRQNLQLQLPFLERIVAEHPDVEVDLWDLCWDPADHEWLQTIKGERINVVGHLYDVDVLGRDWWAGPALRFMDVYRHYTDTQYKDCLLIKSDDDSLFIETDRLEQFIDAVAANRQAIVSAQVVNNGACCRTMPKLWDEFKALSIPLADVHESAEFAELCHSYMFEHWSELINQPIRLIPTSDHLSINLIGFDWRMLRRMVRPIYARGDETVVNEMPRLIMQGCLACHLYFGPQREQMSDEYLLGLRQRYAEVGAKYLNV